MNMGIKAGGYGFAAVIFYLNANFGEAFYVLAGLLLVDALLNYKDESVYLQKLMVYLVSSGSAFYVQNASLSGIPMARGLMVALAIHELAQVTIKVKELLKAWKVNHPGQAVEADQMNANLDKIAAMLSAQLLTAQANQVVPMTANVQAVTPPAFGGVNGE